MTGQAALNLGALFDWDGVVIDSSAQHEKSWELLAREIGRSLPENHFVKGFGMKNQFIIPDVLGWTDDADEIERYSLRKEQLYRDIISEEGIRPLDGVRELLEMLNHRGVPCSVASSTHRENVEVVFDAIGLRGCFDAVITAEDVGRGKPHPEVFLKGAEKIGRPATRCIVFEDAHVGIEAGLAAGCKVVAVATTNRREDLGRAQLAVDSLEEIRWRDLTALFNE